MKKIRIFSLLLFFVTFLAGCVKNEEITYTDAFAEVDAASWNANSAGVTYPILTRRLPENRPVSTSVDSTARRFSGTIRVRVNLVAPQSGKEETVGYKIFSSPITSVAFPATLTAAQAPPLGQTPAQPAATLAVSDAVAGTHYTALSGKVTIPAGSSFGYIDIQVLNPGSTAGQARFLGIEIDGSGSLRPSMNYNKVGIVIDQR